MRWLEPVPFLLLLAAAPSVGQEDFFGEIGLRSADAEAAPSESDVTVLGFLEEKIAYGLERPDGAFSRDYAGLSKIETSSYLQLDWRLRERANFRCSGALSTDGIYRLKRRADFSDDEIDEFEKRADLRDCFMEAEVTDRLYLKLGYQVIAWGVAETVQVSDLASPLNQFTLGHQDLEDLRWQVPALLATWSVKDWVLDAVVTYRAGRNRIAPAYDEFDPFVRMRQAGAVLTVEAPHRASEMLLRASTHFNGGDLSIVFADVSSNSLHVDRIYSSDDAGAMFLLRQDRFQAIALAGSMVHDSWLFFAEVGAHLGRALPRDSDARATADRPWREGNQFLSVAGVEYNGVKDVRLRFELNHVHTDYADADADSNVLGYAVRFAWDGLRDRLHLVGVWNRLANGAGAIGRLALDYELSDDVELGLLYVHHEAERGGWLADFQHNDTVQLRLKYSFQR